MRSSFRKYLLPVSVVLLTAPTCYMLKQKNLFKPEYWNTCRKMSSVSAASPIAPAVFVNHGGGPMPLLGDKSHIGLTQFLRDEVKTHLNFKEIKSIVLVTAHWEGDVVTISGADHHDLYFDYYGFPKVSYTYKYDAPGNPALAKLLKDKLKEQGIESKIDTKRGWDHGVFVPMMLIRPEADIPIVQISVLKNQDPEQHWKLGQILYELRKDGVAVFGSGMSYHNMRSFMSRNDHHGGTFNDNFDQFLNAACLSEENERKQLLINWRKQPGSADSHPMGEAEHFMPLIVVAGAGGSDQGKRIMSIVYTDKYRLSSFIWKAAN